MNSNGHIDVMAQQVSQQVTAGRRVEPRPWAKVAARELTIEYEPEDYPEVGAAFEAYCRLIGVHARLAGYSVRPVRADAHTTAQVTATVQVDGQVCVGSGSGDDVVTGSVRAFAAALERSS